ncbi:MAG: hypothetical protein JRJ87_05730 [Deltaproteobacteria bacterium]|nr:hypothetical protein [Deltaproteobacteria bacterium]
MTGRIVVDGEPVDNALVFVLGEPEKRMTTGPDGLFDIVAPAGEGNQLVAIWGASLGLRESFDLAGEAHAKLGDLEVKSVGVLKGTLDHPEPNQAEVSVDGTPFVSRPGNDGVYSFFLPSGKWDLTLSATGYVDQQINDVDTDSGQTGTTQTISLPQDPDYSCVDTENRVERFSQGGSGLVDILFLVDNSGSMVGEQNALATSIEQFTSVLEEGDLDYRIAVVTTGMESVGCPYCDAMITAACMNETGETGRFQDRLGKNNGTVDDPDYVYTGDTDCRVVNKDNLSCFYDPVEEKGTVLVGVQGCGYERGLAAMRTALSVLVNTYNSDFLRDTARLAVIVVSDEDDCGEVGDVTEGLPGISGNVCYYAAKGVGPEGEFEDPQGKSYQLTPVVEYAQFLEGLKAVPALVTFSAVVGLSDPNDPSTTSIEYFWDATKNRYQIEDACITPTCTGVFCFAEPATRYIKLAQLTNGAIETICQEDFSEAMLRISGVSTGFRRKFELNQVPADSAEIEVFVDSQQVSIGWNWEPEKNSVVFDESFAPPPYSLVEIRYETACN